MYITLHLEELHMLNGWHGMAYNGKVYNIFTFTIVNMNVNIHKREA